MLFNFVFNLPASLELHLLTCTLAYELGPLSKEVTLMWPPLLLLNCAGGFRGALLLA